MAVDAATRRFVRQRAMDRCEYCRCHQQDQPFLTFHVEHIIARQHGGSDHESNLCVSCHWCNLHKGPNLTTLVQGELVLLFHRRTQVWHEHFEISGERVAGLTLVGMGTVALLNMNDEDRIELRRVASRFKSRDGKG
jgi:hypothetical protein